MLLADLEDAVIMDAISKGRYFSSSISGNIK